MIFQQNPIICLPRIDNYTLEYGLFHSDPTWIMFHIYPKYTSGNKKFSFGVKLNDFDQTY